MDSNLAMHIHREPSSLRSMLKATRTGQRIALVPTMGNLHAGHLSLVKQAGEEAEIVVVSIFVNPMQFGPREDYEKYPRTPEEDRRQLKTAGVHHLFFPETTLMYPSGMEEHTRVIVPGLSDILCGASRPGHFIGVATVVLKLLNLVQPDIAVFGEKDYQQLVLIRRLAADLCLPVKILGGGTVRESDGLAISSRNRYLSDKERHAAPALHQALLTSQGQLQAGNRDFKALEAAGRLALEQAGFAVDYYTIRSQADLQEASLACQNMVVLAAASLGNTRLIDGITVKMAV